MESTVTAVQAPRNGGDIPLDVLEVIFKSLLPYDLAICCRINKAVHSIAIEALYRDLRPTRRNIMALCLKLSNEPQLARRARTFILQDASVDMLLGIISDALTHLPRLRTLILFIGPLSSWILPRGDTCPFVLQTFATGFHYDAPLVEFLNKQKDLRHLTVSVPSPARILRSASPPTLHNLVSISAPLSVVQVLLPGRPVHEVTTYSTPGPGAPSLSCLSRSTTPIRHLMLNYTYLHVVGCEVLASATPSLTSLTIDADGVRPHDEEMLAELTEWIEEYLSYAKALSCLSIRLYPMLSIIPCQELDFSDMITSIFAASSKLIHVVIAFHTLKAKYICKRIPGHDWYIVND